MGVPVGAGGVYGPGRVGVVVGEGVGEVEGVERGGVEAEVGVERGEVVGEAVPPPQAVNRRRRKENMKIRRDMFLI